MSFMDQLQIQVEIAKADPDRQLVFGWANVSLTSDGKPVVDFHGDIIPPDVLESACYDYVLRYREGGLEHQKMGVARVVECAFVDPEKLAAMGVKTKYKGAGIWIGMKVDDPDVWAQIKAGELPAFSIGGLAVYEEIG